MHITVIATGFEKTPFPDKKSSNPFARKPANPQPAEETAEPVIPDIGETDDEKGASIPPIFDRRPEQPRRPAPRPNAQRPAQRPQQRSAGEASTRIPPRQTPRTYGDADAFAEPRPARRGFSPDRPSFLGNREKKGE